MLKKLTPVKLSENTQKQIANQTIERSAPKSTDPKNFPVFEIPTGKKILIYVPNHNIETPDGNLELRMDKPLIHSIQDGRRFLSIRCINGLEDPAHGYDGTCPLCDGTADPWSLARKKIEAKCSAQGLDPDDTENKDVKAIRSAEFSDRVLKEANRYYTFPIAVIDTSTDEKGKMSITRDENGGIKYQLFWYSISEAQYTAKWVPALEAMEEEPSSPGGYFFYLNFNYDTKGKEMNKRDAARNMTVNHRNMSKMSWYDTLRTAIDKASEGWTPEKAQETVIANAFYEFSDLVSVADDVLADTRNKLALYENADIAGELDAPKSAPALPGMKKVEAPQEPEALEEVGETDEDFD